MLNNNEQVITLHTMIQQFFTAHKEIIVLLTSSARIYSPCHPANHTAILI